MDKRFLLALGLTAIVVIVTPWLFGTQSSFGRKVRRDTAAQLDSGATTPVIPVDSSRTLPPVASPVVSEVRSATAASESPLADTTTVNSRVATYRLSSLGAAPISVDLKAYKALDGSSQDVILESKSGRLIAYRLYLPGDTIDLNRVPFTLTRSRTSTNNDVLTYSGTASNAQIVMRYTFSPDSYLVRISGEVQHPSANAGFVAVEMPTSLRSAEADSLDDQQHLAYAVKPQRDNARGIPFSKVDPGERRLEPGPITWVAAKNKYFIVGALVPEGGVPFAEVSIAGGARTGRRATQASAIAVAPIHNGAFSFELYTGPQEWRRLLALGRGFENSNPYGGFLQGVVQPFATIVMRILLWMRATLSLSYGWVLVIFGVAVRLLLWPLNQKAMRTSMKMSRLQPELAEIQKRYKSDPQRMQSEIMRVYRDHGMSPFSSLSGCLPMLLPMPILFALFFVFQNTIEFRGVPFLWLNDISLKDPYFIVPVVMGLSMFVLSIIGMRNSPPNPQAKMMAYVLPVMMTVFFLNLASGLNLYYAVQNLTAIPQQWLIANERAKSTMTPTGVKT
jgi:YidC/Oxa1 family membrane protein insertase